MCRLITVPVYYTKKRERLSHIVRYQGLKHQFILNFFLNFPDFIPTVKTIRRFISFFLLKMDDKVSVMLKGNVGVYPFCSRIFIDIGTLNYFIQNTLSVIQDEEKSKTSRDHF